MNKENKLIIEWVDYGWWKNWTSPWGEIGLEQRPDYCNRGRLQFKTETEGAVNFLFHHLLSGAYFFDEERAYRHLESVIKLAQSLSDEQLSSFGQGKISNTTNINGVDSKISLSDLTLGDGSLTICMVQVFVHPEKITSFCVDDADHFPRYYCDRSIAVEEAIAWMWERNQIYNPYD